MRTLLTLSLIAVSSSALAHTGASAPNGFAAGFAHPLAGLDHILAMVAVGLLAAVLGGRALLFVPLAFLVMMAVGFGLGTFGIYLPFVELGMGLSVVVIAGVAALGRALPLSLASFLVGTFAVYHGHAHGTEMAATASLARYASGFLAATAFLHLAGITAALLASTLLQRYGRTAMRLAAGAFALGGAGLLAGWL